MKMPKIQIAKMTLDDVEGVYEVEKTSFPIPWPIESIKSELSNLLATYLVAKVDDKVAGYMGVWFVMDECHITNLAVHEDFRRMGIATKLIDEILKLCKEHQTQTAILEVRVNNFVAQSLYSKYGFKPEIIRKGYYKNPDNTREDAIVMIKENF